ncbi:hypothetical protein G5714_006366 [Onychostoma macrolepis]|uniref:GST C-terminal domain-containing protein n=1 Tax=Onychostoma macrolepis TaxID=369639 RepID=A0A7J6D3P3_9TELE|nr:hypothetical protein G5714_006366 [Onychostoma macrolepis]
MDSSLLRVSGDNNAPDHWYPKLSQKRAQVDEYTAWHHGNTRMHISTIFLQEVRFPMLGVPTNPAKFEKALKELDGTLNMLENMFLKRQTFLCGEDISLADLLAVCELMQADRNPWDGVTPHKSTCCPINPI